MCRSIRPLHNYDPPTTPDDVHEAALQYVRKVSGMRHPARRNEAAFEKAVEVVEQVTAALLGDLVATGPAHDRQREIEIARLRRLRNAS